MASNLLLVYLVYLCSQISGQFRSPGCVLKQSQICCTSHIFSRYEFLYSRAFGGGRWEGSGGFDEVAPPDLPAVSFRLWLPSLSKRGYGKIINICIDICMY